MSYNALSGSVLVRHPGNFQANYLSGNLSNSDGSDVINVPRISNATNNSVITNVGGDANNLTCESNLKFDGDTLSVTGELSVSGDFGLGTTSPSELLHLKSSENAKPVLLIENTNADAVTGLLKFYKSSTSSPAAGDQVGLFKFVGKDAAGDDAEMAFIVCKAQTVTDSAYEGGLHFGVASAGANAVSTLSLVGQGTAKTTYAVFGDPWEGSTTTKVGIGVAAPLSSLDVEGNVAIGESYSGTTAAPTNGLIVEANVGVGQSSPTSDNSTAKFVHIGDSSVDSSGLVLQDNEGKWEIFNNGWLVFKDGTESIAYFKHTGNKEMVLNTRLGIGVSTPTHQLQVAGTMSGSSTLEVVGATTLGSTLNVSGAAAFASTTSGSGQVTYGNNVLISGDQYVGGTLNVTGNADFNGTVTCDTSLTIDSTTITAAEIGLIDGLTAGTVVASKAVTVDGSKNVATLGTVGCGAITSTGDMSVTGDTITFTSTNATDPLVIIKNTTNDADGARLRFVKDKGAAGAANDVAGLIEFYADDASQDQVLFAKVEAAVAVHTNGQEGGKLSLGVATHDGEMQSGLILADGDAEDEVDVTIGNGAASLTTIAGDLDIPNGGFALGSDASGDMYYRNASGVLTRIAVGSDNHVLTLNGAVPGWETAAGGSTFTNLSGSGTLQVVGATTLGSTLNVSGAITCATSVLPDAAGGADLGSTGAEWGDVYIADDKKLYFGNDQDASFEYDEDGNDVLLYAGASLRVSDDTKLEFGAAGDATIEYDENGTNELRFAGAAATFEQAVTFDANVTLGNATTDVTTVAGAFTGSLGAKFEKRVGIGTDAQIEEQLYIRTASPTILIRSDDDETAALEFDKAGATGTIAGLRHNENSTLVLTNQVSNADITISMNDGGNQLDAVRFNADIRRVEINPDSEADFDFRISAEDADNFVYIDGTNNVIGITATSAPPTDTRMSISKGATGGSITNVLNLIEQDNNSSENLTTANGVALRFHVAEDTGFALGARIVAQRESSTDTDTSTGLAFWTYGDNASGGERVRIDNDGNVGIGTASPSDTLTVSGETSGSGRATFGANFLMSGKAYIGGTLNVSGAITAGSTLTGAAATFTTIAGTSLALQSGGITATGPIAGATTVTATSTISGAAGTFTTLAGTSLALQSGGITAAGAIAGATTVSGAAATFTTLAGTSLALQSGGITAAGAIAGATTVTATSTVSGAAIQGTAGTLTSLNLQSGGITNAGTIAGLTDILWDVESVGNGATIAGATEFALVTAGNRSNVTLPAASAGKHLRIKLSSSIGDVFVKAGSGDLIEGEPFILMESTGSAITCVAYDAQSWFIV